VGDETVRLDLWALYGRQAPLVGDPAWGATSRTHVLPNPLAPGTYRVFGISEDNLSAAGQVHEQWAVEVGGVRSAFMPDIPDDAVWYAREPLPDDDGDLATVPTWVDAQQPGYDLGLVDVNAPQASVTIVHIEHDGQLLPWSPNSVNDRFVTLACVPTELPAATTGPGTVPPVTAPDVVTTFAPVPTSTEAPSTSSTNSEPSTGPDSTLEVSPESVAAGDTGPNVPTTAAPAAGLAFTGANLTGLVLLGLVDVFAGVAVLLWRRGARRPL
jgi:hypothetical protein